MKRRPDRYETGHGIGPLFETPERAMSGRTDPQTSRDAARRMRESGKVGHHQRIALHLVQRFPGRTAKELGVLLVADLPDVPSLEAARQMLGKRLPELARCVPPLVRADDSKPMQRWWPA